MIIQHESGHWKYSQYFEIHYEILISLYPHGNLREIEGLNYPVVLSYRLDLNLVLVCRLCHRGHFQSILFYLLQTQRKRYGLDGHWLSQWEGTVLLSFRDHCLRRRNHLLSHVHDLFLFLGHLLLFLLGEKLYLLRSLEDLPF